MLPPEWGGGGKMRRVVFACAQGHMPVFYPSFQFFIPAFCGIVVVGEVFFSHLLTFHKRRKEYEQRGFG
jgi:hypothetical protein